MVMQDNGTIDIACSKADCSSGCRHNECGHNGATLYETFRRRSTDYKNCYIAKCPLYGVGKVTVVIRKHQNQCQSIW